MIYSIVDIEADALLDKITVVHCMCVHTIWEDKTYTKMTFTHPEEIAMFINNVNKFNERIIVGHNFMRYDIPALKKVIGTWFTVPVMDSLAFSWILYPLRDKDMHNLAAWGDELRIPKPVILDWTKENIKDIISRCETDVQINLKLFLIQFEYLLEIYGSEDKVIRYIKYIMAKMDCAAEQEDVRWKLDKEKAKANLAWLMTQIEPKLEILSKAMPRDIKYKPVSRPEKFLKKDGKVSEAGKKWLILLEEKGLPEYHVGSVMVEEHNKIGNPQSSQQVKKWLFSLGWVPDYYKYTHVNPTPDNPKGINKVPQVNNEEGTGVCLSVEYLIDKEPAIRELDNLTKLKHRINILEGFLSDVDEEGYLKAEILGLTNTLRFQHTQIVNLPTVNKAYGGIVREVLIAPSDEYELCGVDMAGIEEATKHHYMSFHDPERVKQIRTPGYDPHLNLALVAGLIREDDIAHYKKVDKLETEELHNLPLEEVARYAKIKKIRVEKGKKTNFAAVYGAGGPKIALTAGLPLKEAYNLHRAFWVINDAVKKVAKFAIYKTVGSQMWLFNPVSQFWYTLRHTKDIFSTLNQGTAVYCFDMLVRGVRKRGLRMCGQFHDEWVAPVLKGSREEVKQIANEAINEVNATLKLNVVLGIKVQFGNTYADIH